MEWVAIVSSLALLQVVAFSAVVGKARHTHGIKAPSTTGPEPFMRAFRAHQNTLEQLIVFIPALWSFAWFVRADLAAAFGVVFLISRLLYFVAYLRDPASRGLSFVIGLVAIICLLIGTIVGALLQLL